LIQANCNSVQASTGSGIDWSPQIARIDLASLITQSLRSRY